MLGWTIFISRLPNGGQIPANTDSQPGESLASWHTGISGINWIDDLVKSNNAVDLGGNGYPLKYTATSDVLLPRIVFGWPNPPSTPAAGATDMAFGRSSPKIDQEAVARCPQKEWLLVEAWDAS